MPKQILSNNSAPFFTEMKKQSADKNNQHGQRLKQKAADIGENGHF